MNALHGLSVWNRACTLTVQACAAVRDCGDLNFRDQITKSSLSVPSNIAEGYERSSRTQFARYLEIAKGSCAELRTQLYIAAQLDLITLQKSTELMQESVEITRMLQALITWCEAGNTGEAPDTPRPGERMARA